MNTQESRPGHEPGPSGTGPGDPHAVPGTEFFDRIRELGVARPDEGRWAAGVCAGLARRWALDPLLVRGLFVVGALVTGIGLGVYGLLWLFLPHPDGRIHAQQVLRGVVTAGFVGAVLLMLFDFPLTNGAWFGWHSGGPFQIQPFGGLAFLAILGFGIWWLMTRNRHGAGGPGSSWTGGPGAADGPRPSGADEVAGGRAPAGPPGAALPPYGTPDPVHLAGGGTEPTDPRTMPVAPVGFAGRPGGGTAIAPAPVVRLPSRPVDVQRPLHSLTLTTLGLAALAVGGVLAWDRAIGQVRGSAGAVAVAVALGVVALGIVLAGALGRRPGGLAPIAVLLAVACVSGAAWHDSLSGARKDITWTPTLGSHHGYDLGAGRAVLDLTSTALTSAAATAPVTVPASLGVGELVVVVPSGTTTQVNSSVGLGAVTDDVSRPGQNDHGGAGLHQTNTFGNGTPAIQVEAKIGLGRIWIVPQGTKVTR
ncbi:MAG TPA: PspC domain-containing protein [Kineosporiaceae bacterium]